MRLPSFLSVLSFAAILSACNPNDSKKQSSLKPETIFTDYRISADETTGLVTFNATYRLGDEEGEALVLDGSGGATLDGKPMAADSSTMGGAYYEIDAPIEDFSGKHTVRFTNVDGTTTEESFVFQTLQLSPELPEVLPREAFTIQLGGEHYQSGQVRLTLTDTSDGEGWINEDFIIQDGRIYVGKELVERLKPGPLFLELHWDDTLRLQKPTKAGGRMVMNYLVRRELQLQ